MDAVFYLYKINTLQRAPEDLEDMPTASKLFGNIQKEIIRTHFYAPRNPKAVPESYSWWIIRTLAFQERVRSSHKNSLTSPLSLANVS